jgi:hypothetical protein
MSRAYSVAKYLAARLETAGLVVRVIDEKHLQDIGGVPARCRPAAGVDVALYVGGRSNHEALVPNTTRENRARNRRVEVAAFRGPARKQPSPARPTQRRYRGICIRSAGPRFAEVRRYAKATMAANRKACERMAALAAMNSKEREAAWNAGPERIWFGRYARASRKVPFAFVRGVVDRCYGVYRWQPTPDRDPCSDRPGALTLECFDLGTKSATKEMRRKLDHLDPMRDNTPGKRWCRYRLKGEQSALDRLYVHVDEFDTFGFSYVCNERSFLHPRLRKPEVRPLKIGLGPVWFAKPAKAKQVEWEDQRRVTIAHEVAHLCGAVRLFAEIYGNKPARRLALRNPWGARVNAENYGRYIMSFQ